MPLYPRIRELREAAKYSQRDISEKLEMLQPQYFRYETGKRDIPTEMLIQLSEIYQVSVDYILGLTDHPQRNP